MIDLPIQTLMAAVLVVAAGTFIQASVGFGLAMIAAPLLHLLDPALVPAPLIITAWTLSLLMVWKEHRAINYSHFMPALAGRLVGSPLAALLLGVVSAVTFDLIFGALVLIAVVLSMLHSNIQTSRRNILLAATASGFMGTISGIGGPPIALVYQNQRGPELRANLAMFFLVGTTISLGMLAVIGRFGLTELIYGAFLQVGVIAGYGLSTPFRKKMDRLNIRPVLLGLCAVSGFVVIVEALFLLSAGH